MSSLPPSSPAIQFSIDDRDLDDAELWAVIDSAVASRSRKSLLAIKTSNYQIATPRNPRFPSDGEFRASSDGEVVHRPPKTARMVVVKNPAMDPVIVSPSPSALAYSSRGPGGRWGVGVSGEGGDSGGGEPSVSASPAVDPWRSVDKENLTPHSLSGWFPSVSTFKQYQNAAMADLLGIGEYRPGVKL